jgi:hypothetical protein
MRMGVIGRVIGMVTTCLLCGATGAADRGAAVTLTGTVHRAAQCAILKTDAGRVYALSPGAYVADNTPLTLSGYARPLKRAQCGAHLSLEIIRSTVLTGITRAPAPADNKIDPAHSRLAAPTAAMLDEGVTP